MFVYPRSRIRIVSIPDPGSRVKKIPDPGSASAAKNLSIYNPKNCFSALGNIIRDVLHGSRSRIRNMIFTHPGSKGQRFKKGTGYQIKIRNKGSEMDPIQSGSGTRNFMFQRAGGIYLS
jgi:hypothetical protein